MTKHRWDSIFVAHSDGTFTCGPCLPDNYPVDSDEVQTWEVGSWGWTAPCVCKVCKTSIVVVVDGEQPKHVLNVRAEGVKSLSEAVDALNQMSRLLSNFAGDPAFASGHPSGKIDRFDGRGLVEWDLKLSNDAPDDDPYTQMGGVCPECSGKLSHCSPSGNGRAACGNCQKVWE